MFFQGFVCKDPRGTYLNEVPAEFVFKRAIMAAAEINPVCRSEYIKILSACIIPVESHAPVTLDAAVHYMVNIRTQILIIMSSLFKNKTPVIVPCHNSHILKMTFSTFVTNRAVVRMVGHKAFDHSCPESLHFRIIGGNNKTFSDRLHARHDYPSLFIVGAGKLFHGTLPACPDRTKSRMKAKIRYVKTKRQAGLEQVPARFDLIIGSVYSDIYHNHLQGQCFSLICLRKSSRKYLRPLCKGSMAPGASAQNVLPGPI
jgi:hypothetical protein